jgi:hypothetical protein
MRIFCALLVVASTAWATGEKVRLAPSAEPLRDAICVSMTCGDEGDFVVSAVEKNGQLELVVQRGSQRRVVHTVALRQGQLSSIDAISASAAVVKAIETPASLTTQPTPRPVTKKQKHRFAVARR